MLGVRNSLDEADVPWEDPKRRALAEKLDEAGYLDRYKQKAWREGYAKGFEHGQQNERERAGHAPTTRGQAQRDAEAFLVRELAGNEVETHELDHRAAAAGIAARTLQRVRKRLATYRRENGKTYWRLRDF